MFRVLLCQEVTESRSLYVYGYILCRFIYFIFFFFFAPGGMVSTFLINANNYSIVILFNH